MNKFQQYLRNRRTRTNIRVMLEIIRDYKIFTKVTQLKITRSQFYNMSEQQRFNLLYDAIGGVEWGNIYSELCWTLLFIGLAATPILGVIFII